jgi:hypothetical protein
MKTFTHIEFNPDGDTYDVYFVDEKPLMQGDYYHDKVTDMFEGVKVYLHGVLNEEFNVVTIKAETKEGDEFWNYDYEFDFKTETLSKYIKRISKDFNLIQK